MSRATATTADLSAFTGYPVRICAFSGPLDLLLHLARVQEVDLAEIPVAEITQQFLEYLHTMQEVNIEVTGEFLVTAAALAYLKSKTLLPPEPEPEEEEPVEDPAVELQRRLAQYHIYKEAAERLGSARRLRERIFLRPVEQEAGLEAGYVTLKDVSLFDMVGAVNQLLKRALPEPVGRVHLPRLSVHDRIEEILLRLATEQRELTFSDLAGMPATRTEIIITFLALLELLRREEIEVRQEGLRGEILVGRAGQTPPESAP